MQLCIYISEVSFYWRIPYLAYKVEWKKGNMYVCLNKITLFNQIFVEILLANRYQK